jgi:hypothetical protein
MPRFFKDTALNKKGEGKIARRWKSQQGSMKNV